MTQSEEKGRRFRRIDWFLLLITVLALCIAVWALFFRNSGRILSPDYAPQQDEQNAESIPGDDGEATQSPEGGGSVSLTYSRNVTIDLSEKTAELLLGNPRRSNQNILLQLVIQDTVILQSGLLRPGYQASTMELLEGAESKLIAGVYEGTMRILFYHPETNEKAVVNTEIPVLITVQD